MEKKCKSSILGVLLPFFISCHNLFLCRTLNVNHEVLALLKLKQRVVSDPFGALKDWSDDVGVVDPCSWSGVQCSHGKVVVLDLKDLCLRGTLAPELRKLIHLKSIILRNNSFTGMIPEGFGELEELEVVDFGYNNFSGPLPPDFGSNLSLTMLLLDDNGLVGSLSPEIQQLKMLSEAQVDKNQPSNSANGSPCNKKSVVWNDAHAKNVAQKRQLKASRKTGPDPLTAPSRQSASPPKAIAPPPTSPRPHRAGSSSSNVPTMPPPSGPPVPSTSIDGSSPHLPVPFPPSYRPQTPTGNSIKEHKVAMVIGTIGGFFFILISIIAIYLFKTGKTTVRPWATGLSGQLQKAFITGVQKLKRSELEAGCEDFSNVIGSSPVGTLYKGTLSSGVEIAVASVAVISSKDWSKNLEFQFRKKIETLSKVNHKNFVNLLGYCEEEEPFTRMMVFEYAPNGTLFEHLHYKESEHLDWGMRLRIAMGMAYCLEHMHQLNPPIAHNSLSSSAVFLAEDYAAKISDFSFSTETLVTETEALGRKKDLDEPLAHPESNVYSFGVLLFELVTGRLPFSVDNGSLEDWASDYLIKDQPLLEILDPTLESVEEEKLERIGEIIKCCVHQDPKRRPAMMEVTARLKEITAIAPDAAIPKLSTLWWAELEILSTATKT